MDKNDGSAPPAKYQKDVNSLFCRGGRKENAAHNMKRISLNLKINLNIARDLTEFLEISG